MTCVEINGAATIDRYLSCPICLGLMRGATATECLHRFCSECIESALRLGKKECPTCRAPIATRRALRRDDNFDNLIRALYPDQDLEAEAYEEEVDVSQYLFEPIASTPRSLFMGKESSPRAGRTQASPVPSSLPKSLATTTAEPKRSPPALEQWTCEACTLLNAGSARKCKACEAPNPARPVKKRLRREKPTETALEVEQPSRTATPNGTDEAVCNSGAGRLVISEWRFADGLVPQAEPSKPASRPRTVAPAEEPQGTAGSRMARQSEWDREIARGLERKRSLEQETREMREERHRARETEAAPGTFAAAKAAVTDMSKQPAPLAQTPLDFDEKHMSVEAQLLARGTFSLDIKRMGDDGVYIIWCYPTGNPGDCNAWISLAPAHRVTEASARQKYKLVTKNKVCGEVR